MRAKEAEARQRKKEREEARMAADPEYAAMMEARKKEYIRTRTAKRKAEHEALVELAKTDEEAARKLAEKRKYQSEATVKCYQKLKADAEAGEFHDGFRHHTGHFRRFPSGQDAVAGFQVVAHAGHQAGDAGAFPFQIGDAQIIQEKERVAARGKNVVDVHGHQVFAGGFHHVQFKENFRLGAYAVAPGDDDRFLIGTQIIGSGEKAKGLVKGSLFLRSFNVRADVGYKSGCFFGIDPRLLVG